MFPANPNGTKSYFPLNMPKNTQAIARQILIKSFPRGSIHGAISAEKIVITTIFACSIQNVLITNIPYTRSTCKMKKWTISIDKAMAQDDNSLHWQSVYHQP